MPYFSVVIPCLNEERYLPLLLQNLNEQTFKDFEVFVVDGNSEDNTQKIIHSFPANFSLTLLVSSKRNVSHQRNLGAKNAKGDVLIFFDADTQIPTNYLHKVHAAFIQKKPDLLTTWMKPDSKKATYQFIATAQNLIFEAGRLLSTPSCYGAMFAIKRSVFKAINGFDSQTKFGEDSQIVKQAMKQGYRFIVLPEPKYIFSMRRFQKEGTAELMYQYIKLNLTVSLDGYHSQKPNYPMGGQLFNPSPSDAPLLTPFKTFFNAVKTTSPDKKQDLKALFAILFPPLKKGVKSPNEGT